MEKTSELMQSVLARAARALQLSLVQLPPLAPSGDFPAGEQISHSGCC